MLARLAALATMLAAALAAPAIAQAAADFDPCNIGFECANIAVPIDRSGVVPGTVGVHIERLPALKKKQVRRTVFLLAGGPGQSATDAYPGFAYSLAARLPRVELIVYDQRGTGLSDPLRCAAFLTTDQAADRAAFSQRAATCANEIGPARAFFRTLDTVADIEAVREAIGVERIGLLGVSYGTLVAQAYARLHPDRVELLVLDSVVAGEGRSGFELSTLAAIPRVLRDVCARGRCAGVTGNPVADLETVVEALGRTTLRGSVSRDRKLFVPARLGGPDAVAALAGLIVSTDLAPAVQAMLPSVLRSAAKGDAQPLFRVISYGQATVPPRPRVFSDALGAATLCAETRFPWTPATPLGERDAALATAIAAVDPASIAPFGSSALNASSLVTLCHDWPESSTPGTEPALPAVPTLILSGRLDTRTPLEDAKLVAAEIPGANHLIVPNFGHSSVATDCGFVAVARFLRDKPIGKPCAASPPPEFDVPPVAPTSLGGLDGSTRHQRTARAVYATIDDLTYAIGQGIDVGRRFLFPGLRSGWGEFKFGEEGVLLDLHKLSYVPGVTLTGTVLFDGKRLTAKRLFVAGGSAARGVLRLSKRGILSGRLGGEPVSIANAGTRPLAGMRALAATRVDAFQRVSRRLTGARTDAPTWYYGPSALR